MEWYYILGMISYGIFLVQFIFSLFGGDTDLDVDFDGETDFDTSSLLSFKGLVHFAMGFSGWLILTGKVTLITVCIGVMVGLLFMVMLYYLYKLCMRFHSEPTEKRGVELIGYNVIVNLLLHDGTCICSPIGFPYQELRCIPLTQTRVGDVKNVSSYENGIYKII